MQYIFTISKTWKHIWSKLINFSKILHYGVESWSGGWRGRILLLWWLLSSIQSSNNQHHSNITQCEATEQWSKFQPSPQYSSYTSALYKVSFLFLTETTFSLFSFAWHFIFVWRSLQIFCNNTEQTLVIPGHSYWSSASL